MRTLIVGNGWLGNILKDYLNAEMSVARLEDLDLGVISNYDCIINTAAKTNIDWCEENRKESLMINALDASDIAHFCGEAGVKYVFISSACIFESKHPNDWKDEYSLPNPGCWYSVTKNIAEILIRETNPDSIIIRIRLPISERPHPRNTITKILNYPLLQTNQETVTVIEDMLPALRNLIDSGATGIFHLVNSGTISPFEIRSYFGGKYDAIRKEDMDKEFQLLGRAKRVTSLVKSTRVPALPNIRNRMPNIAKKYQSSL